VRTVPVIAGLVGATAVAVVTLRGPATPAYDGPVALAAPGVRPSVVPLGSTDWAAVVADLDAARLAAFADPLTADPRRWAEPTCACFDLDRSALEHLVRSGAAVRGMLPELREVAVVSTSEARATLEVADVLPAYDVVASDGRATRYAGRDARRWRGVLVRRGGAWRWAELARSRHDPAARVDPGRTG